MLDISCDECGKKYRVDESKMKGAQAKVKCKACGNIMVVARPGSDGSRTPLSPAYNLQLSAAADKPMPPPSEPQKVPQSVVERPRDRAAEQPAAQEKAAPELLATRKIRFGLFGKIIIVMLIVSLLPFAVFWAITLRETSQRIRIETENLMAQTAKGLGIQVDSWIDNNVSILRAAARLPEIITMNRVEQEPVLKIVQKEYPWMYLVFTVGLDGMNVARNDGRPLTDYSDRQYYKDVLAGKLLSWQTLIGRTSKQPALVLAVPIKSGGTLVGIMAAAMTIDEISNHIATWRQGKTGFAFLIDEKGYVVAHPDKEYVVKRENLNSHPLIAGFRKKGWLTTTAEFKSADGESAVGYVRSNNLGWALALQQKNKEAFAALNRVQEFALVLLGCTVLLVLVISYVSARTIVRPIMSLTDAAERMSLGDLNVKIDIKSKDEIGLLAQAIGRMQTSLRLAMNRLRRKR